MEYRHRRALAEELHAGREQIAVSVADRVFARHPEWQDRHAERTRERGQDNVDAQISYLAGAVVAGEPGTFEQYAHWAASVLSARGVPRSFLADNLIELRTEAVQHLERTDVASPAGVALVDELIRSGLAALEVEPNGGSRPAGADVGFQVERGFYLEAAKSGDRDAALAVAHEALDSGATVPQIYRHIVEPVQHEIGRLWQRNEINVAREHAATAVSDSVRERLHTFLDTPRPWRGTALIVPAPGEEHVLGAQLVAHVLEADGWDARFLGTPAHENILDAVARHDPELVAVSTTVLFNLPAAADLVTAIRRAGTEPTILVGGAAFRGHALWREIGAHGRGNDLQDAVTLAADHAPR
jgi:methanogenic corrinoid protein MtbC1